MFGDSAILTDSKRGNSVTRIVILDSWVLWIGAIEIDFKARQFCVVGCGDAILGLEGDPDAMVRL